VVDREQGRDVVNVGHFFDGYAEDFSSIYKEDTKKRSSLNTLTDKLFRKDIESRFNTTIALTDNDSINSILDIGCGPGHFVVRFLEQGKDVTALDIAPSMLEITKRRVESMQVNSPFVTILADYSEYTFSKTFDAACVMGVFEYIQDPVTFLKKLLLDIDKEIYISISDNKGLLAWQRRLRYKIRKCPLYLYSRNQLEDCLKKADCYDLAEIEDLERGYYVVIRK